MRARRAALPTTNRVVPAPPTATPQTKALAPRDGPTPRVPLAKTTVLELLEAAGSTLNGDGPRDVRVHDESFFTKLLEDPALRLGETYMDGLWDCSAIDELVTALYESNAKERLADPAVVARTPALLAGALARSAWRGLRDRLTNRQNRARSTTVAKEHYDAGNELYRRMLDPTMTYTCGVFADGYDLEDAQNAKYDLLCRKLDLKPGQKVLDIGCGFGGFARFAAKNYGAEVVGITISTQQLEAARARSEDVPGTDFRYLDYRDLPHTFPEGTFDHVVSIEMIEAVGPKNLGEYFDAAAAALKPGGRFALQAIASNTDVVNCNPWFSKYIFHEGVAPSRNQVDKAAARSFGAAGDVHRLTADYDKTLLEWNRQFQESWPALESEYGDRFKRMWEFYLLSVAGGFRTETLQLDQVVYTKGSDEPVAPVRDLPSRERLDAMRTSPEEIRRTEALIAKLDAHKAARAEAAAKAASRPKVPLPKDSRICVVGAGPSGLTLAREMKKLGYRNVDVLERDAEVGGKSYTVEVGDRAHDLGATMGVRYKYDGVVAMAEDHGVETIDFPAETYFDLSTGGVEQKPTGGARAQFFFEAFKYLLHSVRHNGLRGGGLDVPDPDLADPWSVVSKRGGFENFAKMFDTYLTGFGYGDGVTTPSLFGMRMMDASATIGAATKKKIMWDGGTRPIWEGVAKELDVQTNASVRSIRRDEDAAWVHVDDEAEPRRYDKLVIACDPQAIAPTLDTTAEEQDLFRQIRHMPYSTFACRVEGVHDDERAVGYIRENMTLERQGHPMAWIKRYADDDVFVFHLFAPEELSDDDVMARIREDMTKIGATNVTLEASRRWPFFPHVDADSVRVDNFFERAQALQGENRTAWVNEVLSMSTMADVSSFARRAARRIADGTY